MVDHEEVSRIHVLVLPSAGRYLLLDFKSSNGTRLNGRYVTWSYLYDGDVIQLADQEIVFSSLDVPAPG